MNTVDERKQTMRSSGRGGGMCGQGRGKARGMGMRRGMGRQGGCGMKMGGVREAGSGRRVGALFSVIANQEACEVTEINREKRSVAAVVEEEKCTGCGACVDACPENAIFLRQTALITIDKCIGCGSCIPECPNDAISLYRA